MDAGARPAVADRRSRAEGLAFAAASVAVGAAVAVCLFAGLGTPTLGVDEPVYAQAGWEYVHGTATQNLEHPYLAKQLIGLSQLAFGQTVVGARVVGAVLAAGATLLVFEIARRTAGRWAGLGAAALFGVLPQAPGTNVLRLDRVAALESAMVFALTSSLLLAVVALQRGRRSLLAGAAVAAGLAASAKFPGAVAVVPVAVVALVLPGSPARRLATLAVAGVLACLGFWLPYAVQGDWQLHGLAYALEFQAQHAATGHAQVVAGSLRLSPPWWSHWWWQQTYLGPVLTAALWLCAVSAVGRWVAGLAAGRRRASEPIGLVAALLAVSVVFLLVSPLVLPHYHLLWAAPLTIAAAVGARELLGRRRTLPLAALLIVPAVVVGGRTVVEAATLEPSDYARLPSVLADSGTPAGPVLVWGYERLAQHYLPAEFPLAVDAREVSAVVVDPVVAERGRGSERDRLVRRTLADCGPARSVDRLLVHLCPAPDVGSG